MKEIVNSSSFRDQTSRFLQALSTYFISENSKPPVLFVGAGVSRYLTDGCNVPRGWKVGYRELVENFSEALKSVGFSHNDLENDKLTIDKLWVLKMEDEQTYLEKLIELYWADSQSSSTGIDTIRNKDDGKRWNLIRFLFEISGCVITTNYDPICISIIGDLKNEKDWKLTNLGSRGFLDKDLLDELLDVSAKGNYLIYWHGGIDMLPDPSKHQDQEIGNKLSDIVLTSGDFAKAYPYFGSCDAYQIKRTEFFRELYMSRPILFLGYSLRDEVIRFLITQLGFQFPSRIKHFTVLSDKTNENDISLLIRVIRNQLKINPIFYEATKSEIESKLDQDFYHEKSLESRNFEYVIDEIIDTYKGMREVIDIDIIKYR